MKPRDVALIPDEVWSRVRFCGRVYAVVAYLERNPRPLSLRSAAAIAGMERTSFCRLFRHRIGMSFSTFLAAYRLEQALRRMVESDSSLETIAADVGFGSTATFRRRFARALGTTPSKFRASQRIRRRMASSAPADADRASTVGDHPLASTGVEMTLARSPRE